LLGRLQAAAFTASEGVNPHLNQHADGVCLTPMFDNAPVCHTINIYLAASRATPQPLMLPPMMRMS
jgi:hypothetical protein